MKVKELVGKMNVCSTVEIIMKTSIMDPGHILVWRHQETLFGGECTVRSFEIVGGEMVIYYNPKSR